MRKLLLFFILITSQLFYSQSDCVSAIPVCGNSGVSYTPSGPGSVIEDLGGCLTDDENFSVWYTFTVATSGTLAFTIDANNNSTDYDFAVYAPNATCASLGAPIRCNFYGVSPTGNTGLELTDSGVAYYEPYLDVVAGQTYYLVIDNYSNAINSGFSLIWEGTATLSSAFSDPTLAPNPFIAPGTPNPAGGPNLVPTCPLPGQYDFSTLTTGILNGNTNFVVSYHTTANDALSGTAPITTPITVNGTDTYYYSIRYQDPANPTNPLNNCRQTGTFKFILGVIPVKNATVFACANNGATTATFDLTTADVYFDTTAIKKFYLTMADLNAGINEIQNPNNYNSVEKRVYAKITTNAGCTGNVYVDLKFHPIVIVNEATIEECFLPINTSTASFNLNLANVTSQPNTTKKFYLTLDNAVNGTNEISNTYISSNSSVYVRVFSQNGCYAITKINLKVLTPVNSTVLKDKTICLEDRTTLDAGAGFDGYEWSTGATTQVISNVGVGAYWVKLKTGKCFTLQQVHVYPTQKPVIASLDIKNNTITVNVTGGSAPYQYSLDGTNWQDSNLFTGLPRGENKIFVKDSYDCNPVQIQVTVPNLINAITPNGDNMNDEIDYTALAYKKNLVFTVYNRYGNKIYEADKIRNFKWNGTSGGKKIQTGTYWYTITWNEDDANNTPTKYDGWVLVKNRE
ncbi:gliding motility-associated C-terminal domain-containing protein [Chryseobacterium formosus]|uniref:Gliding motility-associated C-terminal domain-containing protein n=1 Tax=Chryseobacterium formosus TaxID=1537363 RepID=A0ABT3XJP3_9FLAO|nr:gliding motility-associated C-terminal domain-containing protein [Chryseobacterium formosus]MCX8522364.1 gliding motility-associated C-terminal domain-containing protein [Chryseobacterium formosus]